MGLNEKYKSHKKLEFPEFPENNDFSEWVEELIEVDGYYAGLIASYLSGNKIKLNNNELNKIIDKLNKFSFIKSDALIYNKCEEYLDSLKNLLEEFENRASN